MNFKYCFLFLLLNFFPTKQNIIKSETTDQDENILYIDIIITLDPEDQNNKLNFDIQITESQINNFISESTKIQNTEKLDPKLIENLINTAKQLITSSHSIIYPIKILMIFTGKNPPVLEELISNAENLIIKIPSLYKPAMEDDQKAIELANLVESLSKNMILIISEGQKEFKEEIEASKTILKEIINEIF